MSGWAGWEDVGKRVCVCMCVEVSESEKRLCWLEKRRVRAGTGTFGVYGCVWVMRMRLVMDNVGVYG